MNDQQPNADTDTPDANLSFAELKRELVLHAVTGWKGLGFALGDLETLLAHNGLPVDAAEALKSPEILKCLLALMADHSVSESDVRKWYMQKPEGGAKQFLISSWQTKASRLFLKRAPLSVRKPRYEKVTRAEEQHAALIGIMRRLLTNMRKLEAELELPALELSQHLLNADLTDFGEYMDEMVSMFGTGIKPYLRDYYETLAMRPQNQALDLTEPDDVERISELEVLTKSEIQRELVENAAEGWEQLCAPIDQLDNILLHIGLPGSASKLLENPEQFRATLDIIADEYICEATMRKWYYHKPNEGWLAEAVELFAEIAPLY